MAAILMDNKAVKYDLSLFASNYSIFFQYRAHLHLRTNDSFNMIVIFTGFTSSFD